MASQMKVGVGGANGRMGRAVIETLATRQDATLGVAFGRDDLEGQTSAGVILGTAERAMRECDVIIDFSTHEASSRFSARAGLARRPPLVLGATGFSQDEEAAILKASRSIPVVKSGNFSIGVNVLAGLVQQASRRLGPDVWDIEILEAHHRRKRDAPSGTALMLGDAAAKGRDVSLDEVSLMNRERIGAERARGEIGFAVMRAGGIVGEHSVVFAAEDEILTLSHSARDRRLFARGAIEAALWIIGRPPGLYAMADVLGFND